jgi:hypothetical protein
MKVVRWVNSSTPAAGYNLINESTIHGSYLL